MNKFILTMVVIRIISGSIEIMAAFLMYRIHQLDKALLINTSLAFVGPLVLIATTTIGLVGLSDKLSMQKMAWILVGVCCLFVGVLKK
ncbi:YqhV family protein [Longirhabdus pacifica]|uniref:YqhV family protein n=1 Tax=Longirhabdus pacifica TaxID=2305227 RepID=UPI001008D006|nr:YqhV family protein [Longirhabdus pacifica]